MSVHSRKVAKATVTYDTRDGGTAALIIKDSAIFPDGFKHTFRRDSKQAEQIRDVFLGQPKNNDEWEALANNAYHAYLGSTENTPTKFFLGADRRGHPVVIDLTESQVDHDDFLDVYLGDDPLGVIARFLKLQALTRRNPLTIVDVNYRLGSVKYIRDGKVAYEANVNVTTAPQRDPLEHMVSVAAPTNPSQDKKLLNLLREEDRPVLVFITMQLVDVNGVPTGQMQNIATAQAINLIRSMGRGKDHIENVRVVTDFDLRNGATTAIVNTEKEHGRGVHTVDAVEETKLVRLPSSLITDPPMLRSIL